MNVGHLPPPVINDPPEHLPPPENYHRGQLPPDVALAANTRKTVLDRG